MEGVGARLGRSSARYGPATTFTGPVRKWRKEWVPIAAAMGTATSAAASSTGTGSRGNNLVLFKWSPLSGANRRGGDEEPTAPAETAMGRRRYVPVSVVEDQRQESAKSDDEKKANDGQPSSTETGQSNGKTNIDGTLMDESQQTRHGKYRRSIARERVRENEIKEVQVTCRWCSLVLGVGVAFRGERDQGDQGRMCGAEQQGERRRRRRRWRLGERQRKGKGGWEEELFRSGSGGLGFHGKVFIFQPRTSRLTQKHRQVTIFHRQVKLSIEKLNLLCRSRLSSTSLRQGD